MNIFLLSTEQSLEEMKKLLLLLLGCAVQVNPDCLTISVQKTGKRLHELWRYKSVCIFTFSVRKKRSTSRMIQTLDFDTKAAIAALIQEVSDFI